MGFLLYRYFPNARGSGVPRLKAALFARDGFIFMAHRPGQVFCTATTWRAGFHSVARDHLSGRRRNRIVLGRWLGLRPEKVEALIPVGAAAAIAAAFNTPMAAVLFSLEEVMGICTRRFGLGRARLCDLLGGLAPPACNNPLFQVPQYTLVHPLELAIYAPVGHRWRFLFVAFTRLLLGMRKFFLPLAHEDALWHPVVGGVTVGLMGWFCAPGSGCRVYLRRQRF